MKVTLTLESGSLERIKEDKATFAWLVMRFVESKDVGTKLDLKSWFGIEIEEGDGKDKQGLEGGPSDKLPSI